MSIESKDNELNSISPVFTFFCYLPFTVMIINYVFANFLRPPYIFSLCIFIWIYLGQKINISRINSGSAKSFKYELIVCWLWPIFLIQTIRKKLSINKSGTISISINNICVGSIEETDYEEILKAEIFSFANIKKQMSAIISAMLIAAIYTTVIISVLSWVSLIGIWLFKPAYFDVLQIKLSTTLIEDRPKLLLYITPIAIPIYFRILWINISNLFVQAINEKIRISVDCPVKGDVVLTRASIS